MNLIFRRMEYRCKSQLLVPVSGTAVCDCCDVLPVCHLKHFLCDEWSGNGLSECVSFIAAVCLYQGKQIFFDKLVFSVDSVMPVSYTHLRAHETDSYLVCRLLLEKKKNTINI